MIVFFLFVRLLLIILNLFVDWHENFHDGISETYMSIRSGHVYKHQYGNPNVSIRADERFTMCSDKPTPSLELPLCNAINRKDLGAKHFVGNLSGRFQLEVFCKCV